MVKGVMVLHPLFGQYNKSINAVERFGKALGISSYGRKQSGQAKINTGKITDIFDGI